jgi:hypothetical protein
MCSTKTLTFFFLLSNLTFVSTSCQERAGISTTESKSQSATTSDAKATVNSPENWQRMKDCAEQADRALKRGHLEQGQRIAEDIAVLSSQNHRTCSGPTEARCARSSSADTAVAAAAVSVSTCGAAESGRSKRIERQREHRCRAYLCLSKTNDIPAMTYAVPAATFGGASCRITAISESDWLWHPSVLSFRYNDLPGTTSEWPLIRTGMLAPERYRLLQGAKILFSLLGQTHCADVDVLARMVNPCGLTKRPSLSSRPVQ